MFDNITLKNTLENMFPGEIILAEAKANDVLDLNIAIVDALVKKQNAVIIISSSRPEVSLRNMYKHKNIEDNDIYIIDTLSKQYNPVLLDKKNTFYVDSVADLTHIAIDLEKITSGVKKEKDVLLDSITTMLIHNDDDTFVRFIHSLLTKLRLAGTSAILLSVSGETNKDIKTQISLLADKVITL